MYKELSRTFEMTKEGVNNKIKTVRRRAYGYPDDEYFFLKLFDYSRTVYVANPLSHRICD